MEKIRILDLGKTPALSSQAVYHAVAYAMNENTPNTIILVSPETPYVCIGLHQELEKEVDLEYCKSMNIPVYRREVGGGAVYLDDGQIFTQWIFQKNKLPITVEEKYKVYIQPLLDTYQSFGINANLRPVNDIHVSGKKIGGTGAAQMGISEVVVGSLMFDFDKKTMSKILKVPSEKMRDKIFQSLEEYMTTVKEQLSYLPSRESVVKTYIDKCSNILGMDTYLGTMTDDEEEMMRGIEGKFITDDWLYQKTIRKEKGIKIHEDVRLYESALKFPGGLLRTTLRVHKNKIDDITISGDFTVFPSDSITKIENELLNKEINENEILETISKVFNDNKVESPGLTANNIWETINTAINSN